MFHGLIIERPNAFSHLEVYHNQNEGTSDSYENSFI